MFEQMQHYVRVQIGQTETEIETETDKDKERGRSLESGIMHKPNRKGKEREEGKRKAEKGKHLLSETQTKAHKLTEKWKLFTRTQRSRKTGRIRNVETEKETK